MGNEDKICKATFKGVARLALLEVFIEGDRYNEVSFSSKGEPCERHSNGEERTNCGMYSHGKVVGLSPAGPVPFLFAGWSGDPDCSDGSVTMDATMDADKTCIATFYNSNLLEVVTGGDGSGTVTSSPAGIACGEACDKYYLHPEKFLISQIYTSDQAVTLTATADIGSVFAGWSGNADCADGSVTMDADKRCSPTFNAQKYTLTLIKEGAGNGTTTSLPAGIKCGEDCTKRYRAGEVIDLTTTDDIGSIFAGWSGDPDCSDGSVTMDADKTCIATFNIQTYTVTIMKAGNGEGTVTSLPIGINCGETCTEIYGKGEVVDLTETADIGSVFVGWSGDTGCVEKITMNADKTCTVTFNQAAILTITKAGTGTGLPP